MATSFRFNKLYVLESLEDNELTGTQLYNDLLKWKKIKHEGKLEIELLSVETKEQLTESFDSIYNDCLDNNYFPMIHIEIHGSKNLDGLITKSGELVSWNELYYFLVKINTIVRNNLFLTLAVCHGGYLMQTIKLDRAAPFWGFIGSFDEIEVYDLMIRYNQFYDEFFDSFDLTKAFRRLLVSNPGIIPTYKFISSEETFKEVYNNYLKDNTSKVGVDARKKQVINDHNLQFINRKDRRGFEKRFAKAIKISKNLYLKKHSEIFFMIDKYPENRKRFNISNSLKNSKK